MWLQQTGYGIWLVKIFAPVQYCTWRISNNWLNIQYWRLIDNGQTVANYKFWNVKCQLCLVLKRDIAKFECFRPTHHLYYLTSLFSKTISWIASYNSFWKNSKKQLNSIQQSIDTITKLFIELYISFQFI